MFLEINASMVDYKGQRAILSINRDITERRRVEETLEKERQRLFSVLDVLPAYVYVQAADYTVPFVNRKFRELFGDPDDRPCYEVFHGRSEPCGDCLTLRVLETRASQSYEWTSKDGRVYMIFEDLFPTIDGPEMVVEVGIDITERKEAEERLRESEESYRELADSITDVFFAMDQDLRYTYWNKASESLTGIRAEDALGKSLLEVFQDTLWVRKAEKVYREVLRTQQPQTFVRSALIPPEVAFQFSSKTSPSASGRRRHSALQKNAFLKRFVPAPMP
jgi:PAS domain-containing protein